MSAPFTLQRLALRPDGDYFAFLHLGLPFAVALARSYDAPPQPCCHRIGDQWTKLPPGRYRCHRDRYNRGGYATFEIEVPGHTDIKFHRGKFETNSDGCILVAESFHAFGHRPGIEQSDAGFREFMVRAADLQAFDLEVTDPPAGVA